MSPTPVKNFNETNGKNSEKKRKDERKRERRGENFALTGLCLLRKRNNYLKATIEIVKFGSSDVLTTSDDDKDGGEKDFFD